MTRAVCRMSARAGAGSSAPPAAAAAAPCAISSARIASTMARLRASSRGQAGEMLIEMAFDLPLGLGDEAEADAIAERGGERTDGERAGIPERIQKARA